ncbi:MAG TPA: Asp23/Gls24 family envelope stress response protein [Anaerolineales bacterium]|nr:Asp23/Gls24 family envelope stress response protein [Anaerolineales bacterium]
MEGAQASGGRTQGSTTIAPGVLVTIARLTALAVPGVTGMAAIPGGVNRLFRKGAAEGVRIDVDDQAVSVDLYLVLRHDSQVREVSRKVQAEVARAIEDMVGMQVRRIDVHIEDMDYSGAPG